MSDKPKATPDEDELEQQIEQWMDGKPPEGNGVAKAPDSAEEITSEHINNEPENNNQAGTEASSLDDYETDHAIEEISKNDSDSLLAAEDEKAADDLTDEAKKPNVLKRWWVSKPWRYGTFALVLALIIAALAIPFSRWWILNSFGARSNVTVTVLDDSTNLALKNVKVTLAEQTKTTPKNGQVKFNDIKLGKQQLIIKKPAFASVSKEFTVNLLSGNNHNDYDVSLKVVGIQYGIKLTDYLTGKPIVGAEVTSGKASALSDTKGMAVLTLNEQKKTIKTTIKASGYNTNKLEINGDKHSYKLKLTPAGKDYFVSKVSGKYDLYSTNLDGSGKTLLLKASGNENSKLQLTANEDGGLLALVSIRDDQRGSGGYRLQALTIINNQTGRPHILDHAKAIHLIGWLDGHTLVYVLSSDCGSQTCDELISYDYANSSRRQLASTHKFVSVLVMDNRIYYATSSDYQSDEKPVLGAVNSDGTNRQVLLKNDIYNVYRSSYDSLQIAALGSWYSYTIGDKQASKIKPPSNPEHRFYVDSPDGKKSAWIERRDGQPMLIIYDKLSNKDKIVASQAGLSYPLSWAGKHALIFRVDSASETADYVLDLNGGETQKITNLTDVRGADDIHY